MSTIRDIASLAKVSTATVSRVLNNDTKYKMTEETRERVWQAVTELNYKPKPGMAELSRGGKKTLNKADIKIGCVLSVTPQKYNDPYFMAILSGVEAQLTSKGYSLSFLRTGYELEDKKQLYSTFSEPITGLILMESLNSDTFDFIRKQVPYIVGIDTKWEDIDNVGYDHFNVACTAVQHLVDIGHTKIGYIGGSGVSKNLNKSKRFNGYFTTMHSNDLPVNPDWIIDCAWKEEVCMEKLAALCKAKNLPTAFFVASDLMAMAAMSSLYKNGVSVPEDVAVIGLSNIEVSKYSNPPLTTINVPMKEIGMVAADLLIARITGDTLLAKKVILPTNLIQRSST
ncbi:MAG: LacI family DNA-binding transcriptional regulator [Mobilitalea sp.]